LKLQDQLFAFRGRFDTTCIPEQDFQYAFGRFSAACDHMKISIVKTQVLRPSRNSRQRALQANGNTLQQAAKFKYDYLVVPFKTDRRRNKEIWTRIGKAKAVLRELCRSMVTKWELWNNSKLSVFKSVFVPILTYGYESWVKIERALSQVQAAQTGFLRRVHEVTFRGKVDSCELQVLNVEPLLPNRRTSPMFFSAM